MPAPPAAALSRPVMPVGPARSPCLARRRVAPDHISLLSLVFAALGAAAMLASPLAPPAAGAALFVAAALCIQLRLLCNLLDGMVAIEGGLGPFLPGADRDGTKPRGRQRVRDHPLGGTAHALDVPRFASAQRAPSAGPTAWNRPQERRAFIRVRQMSGSLPSGAGTAPMMAMARPSAS